MSPSSDEISQGITTLKEEKGKGDKGKGSPSLNGRGFSYLNLPQRVDSSSSREKLKELISSLITILKNLDLTPSPLASDGRMSPLERMIRIILSQNTNDQLVFKAMENLRALAPDLKDLLHLPDEELEKAIRVSGMKSQKRATIKRFLASLDVLEGLENLSLDEALKRLTSIKGIGPKTARVFLLMEYGFPTFPVDTHIYRIFRRLGWLGKVSSPEKLSEIIESLGFSAEELYILHKGLIRFGRDICRAKNPKCDLCPLRGRCAFFMNKKDQEKG